MTHDAGDLRPDLLHSDVERPERPTGESVLLAQQAEQQMLRADVVVLRCAGLALREDDDLPRQFREALEHEARA